MTSFSTAVQTASLFSLFTLFVYTIWLMRAGRLSAHVVIRWLLAEAAAIIAVLLWAWLPLFPITSGLDDRELLVILAVVLFVLIAFLMLDTLVHISTHTYQIKRLNQEVALLRTAMEGQSPVLKPVPPIETGEAPPASWRTTLSIVWIVGCVAFFVMEMRGDLFLSLKAGLTAQYLE